MKITILLLAAFFTSSLALYWEYEESQAELDYFEELEFANGLEIGEMDEEEEDELIDDDDVDGESDDDSDINLDDYPEELDLRDQGIIHKSIWQGMCGSCAFIAGTQTLEGRIAYMSENYVPYSIQNIMNCSGRVCVGASIYFPSGQVRKHKYVVPEDEIPYTRNKCRKWGDGKSECKKRCGVRYPGNFTNALDDQFVIIGGAKFVRTIPQAIKALQKGPLTTCFTRNKRPKGEKCKPGCTHANSIIGYTKTDLRAMENYGKWGPWLTPKDSICAKGLIKKAFYPNIIYDYDRANAYFTELEGGLDDTTVTLLEVGTNQIINDTLRNWGTSKNRCAFIGSKCKGVVELPSGYYLIGEFNNGIVVPGNNRAFIKKQMVSKLRDEASGRYLGINTAGDVPEIILVDDKSLAAPFYTSYGRLISFQYPDYHLVGNTFQLIDQTIREIAFDYRGSYDKKWTLSNCMLYREASDQVFDLVDIHGPTKQGEPRLSLGFGTMNRTETSQRFDVRVSGGWQLTSTKLGLTNGKRDAKKKENIRRFFGAEKPFFYRWQARHIIVRGGYSVIPSPQDSQQSATTEFNIEETDNVMTPIDCSLGIVLPGQPGENDEPTETRMYLNIENDQLVMGEDKSTGWTFEYEDL